MYPGVNSVDMIGSLGGLSCRLLEVLIRPCLNRQGIVALSYVFAYMVV